MGVHGLWQLLQPAGRPVSLEALEGKVLAVDVSIWLHQTMKGMRDKEGNPLPNAHLQGLFSRVCKLLFYRIKPVFVFDGGVPVLKKQTTAARRDRKTEAERESSEITQKLLQNLIKSQAVKQALGNADSTVRHVPGIRRGRNKLESDIFELAPLPESEEIGLSLNTEEWDRDFELQENWIKDGLAALSDAHPDSEEFRSLPMEIQHEILSEMKEQRKYHSLSCLTKMPENSDEFSLYQLKKLVKQSKLTTRIEEVKKEMSSKITGNIAYSLGDEYYGDEVEARRIVSEDATHYVLIKGLTKQKQEEEAEKYEIQKRVKLEQVEESDDEYGGDYLTATKQPHGKLKSKVKCHTTKILSSDSDSDMQAVMAKQLRRKRGQTRTLTGKGKASGKTNTFSKRAKILSSDEEDDGSLQVVEKRKSVNSNTAANISSSEDDGFIEVTVDPSASVEEDELFPASIFQTTAEPLGPQSSRFTFSGDENEVKNKGMNVCDSVRQTASTKEKHISNSDENSLSKENHEVPSKQEHGDAAAAMKRKSVLNDILSQLQEKRKFLENSLMEVNADMITAAESEDFSTSGGFFREEDSSEKDGTPGPSKEGNKDCVLSPEMYTVLPEDTSDSEGVHPPSDSDEDLKLAIELSLQTAKAERDGKQKEITESSSGKVPNTGTPDTHNRIQIPITTTSADTVIQFDVDKSRLHVSSQKVDITLANVTSFKSEDDGDDEDGDFEEVASSPILKLSTKQEDVQCVKSPERKHASTHERIIKVSPEPDQQEESLNTEKQSDANDMKTDFEIVNSNDKIIQQNEDQTDKAGRENSDFPSVLVKHSEITTPTKVIQDRPQPEDYEVEDDVNTDFCNLNEDDLMEMNVELQKERSTLLSEQARQARMATSVTEQINQEAQDLLRLFGIPFIVSPMEAEAQCAYLDITGQTHGTVTDDSDIWLFGGSSMYKNFFNQSKYVEYFSFNNIRNHFAFSREQLINIALLCGSDYTEGIQGVGPVRALEIMAEFPGEGLEGLYMFRKWWDKAKKKVDSALENNIKTQLKKLTLMPGFPSEAVVEAYMNPTVDDSREPFSWGTPDLDLLREFAKFKFGWSRDKTDQSLIPMMKQLNRKENQGRIYSYFQPENFIKTSKTKSERLRKALEMVKSSRQVLAQNDSDEERDSAGDESDNEDEKSVPEKIAKKELMKRKMAENEVQRKYEMVRKMTLPKQGVRGLKIKGASAEMKTISGKLARSQKNGKMPSEKNKEDQNGNEKETTERKCMKSKKPVSLKSSLLEEDRQIKIEPSFYVEMPGTSATMQSIQVVDQFSEKQTGDQFMQMMAENVKLAKVRLECSRDERGAHKVKGTVGARDKILISLDQKQRSQGGRGSKLKLGSYQNYPAGRGALNLSESSSSDDDSGGSSSTGQMESISLMKRSKKGYSKMNVATMKIVDNVISKSDVVLKTKCPGKSHQNCQKIDGPFRNNVSNKGATTSEPKTKVQSVPCRGNSTDIEVRPKPACKINAKLSQSLKNEPRNAEAPTLKIKVTADLKRQSNIDAENKPVTSNKLITENYSVQVRQSKQETGAKFTGEKEGEIDIRKADVSIINKQILPATLTYLNQRSKEDKFLLQQLKGGKVMNAVEKRLEESEKRAELDDKKQEEEKATPVAEKMTFEEMLGRMEKQQKTTEMVKANSTKTIFAGKDKQEIIVPPDQSQGNSKSFDKQKPTKNSQEGSLVSILKEASSVGQRLLKEKTKRDKVGFGSSDESSKWFEALPIIQSREDKVLGKTQRSLAFDTSISASSGDYISRKRKFRKQTEHIHDSKSVKGHGILPLRMDSGLMRGWEFASKGKGVGKNKASNVVNTSVTDGVPLSTCLQPPAGILTSDIKEYEQVTADDLGSDFSD